MVPKFITVEFPSVYDPHTTNKIGVIKAIRSLTGMGLKDAKDLSEKPGQHRVEVHPYVHTCPITGREHTLEESFNVYVGWLRNQGIKVVIDSKKEQVMVQLRELAADCLVRGEYDMTVDLINIIHRYS